MAQKVDFLVDWLEFTYICPEDAGGISVFENFMSEFPEFEDHMYKGDLVIADYGRHGYSHCFVYYDEYSILYHPEKQNFGVHVTFPSHGLYRLCEMFGIKDEFSDYAGFRSVLALLRERHCHITRLDICYDDYSKILTPLDYNKFMTNKQITSKSREWSFISSTQNGGAGSTFYLGKRGSSRFLRVYDKDYESEGRIPAIRYEFELRKKYLDMIVNKVIEGINFSFADLIGEFMVISNEYDLTGEQSTDKNRKARAGILEEWAALLETIRKTHV